MNSIICLDERYSTTRLLTSELQKEITNLNDTSPAQLFLYKGAGRKGEGGLRTKGYFKHSYKTNNGILCIHNCVDKITQPISARLGSSNAVLPLITIITVVFNGAKFLEETIQSIINQVYKNVEFIIIDGGSTDGTLEIIKKYDYAIDYWVSEVDNGIYDAMNKGISVARGEWLNFMNSGDIIADDNTLQFLFESENFGVQDVIYSDVSIRTDDSYSIKKTNFDNLVFVHQSIVYRKSLHNEFGNYFVDRHVTISDYIFFNQVVNKRICKHPRIISVFRTDGVSGGVNSFYQKVSYDFISGKYKRIYFVAILLAYPIYRKIKDILYGRR